MDDVAPRFRKSFEPERKEPVSKSNKKILLSCVLVAAACFALAFGKPEIAQKIFEGIVLQTAPVTSGRQ